MREMSTNRSGSAIRAFTAGMLRGVGLFLLGVAGLVVVLTIAGLGLFVVDGDSFNDDFSPLFFLMGIPTVLVIGGLGWFLRLVADRYDAP
jgi:hypothetical protein